MSISVKIPYADAELLAVLKKHDVRSVWEWNVPLDASTVLEVKVVSRPEFQINSSVIAHAIELLQMSQRSFELSEAKKRAADAVTEISTPTAEPNRE